MTRKRHVCLVDSSCQPAEQSASVRFAVKDIVYVTLLLNMVAPVIS
jgi:hypothetical protein